MNQIHNSWRCQKEKQGEAYGFYDGSIWKNAQRTSDDSIKSLIQHSIKNTSVTCILAGAQTHLRRWVRYEIARSVVKGNGLLTVKIHRVSDQAGQIGHEGHDPLAYMAVYRTPSGRYLLAEWADGNWMRYEDYVSSFTLPTHWHQPNTLAFIPLSSYARSYCYVRDCGKEKFADWIRAATA